MSVIMERDDDGNLAFFKIEQVQVGGSKSRKRSSPTKKRITLSEFVMLGGTSSFIQTYWKLYERPKELFEQKFLTTLLKYSSKKTVKEVQGYINRIKIEEKDINVFDILKDIVAEYAKKKHSKYFKKIMEHQPSVTMDEENGTVVLDFETHQDTWQAQYLCALAKDKLIWFWNFYKTGKLKIPESSLEAAYMGKLLYGDIFGFAPFKDGTVELKDVDEIMGFVIMLLNSVYGNQSDSTLVFKKDGNTYFMLLTKQIKNKK